MDRLMKKIRAMSTVKLCNEHYKLVNAHDTLRRKSSEKIKNLGQRLEKAQGKLTRKNLNAQRASLEKEFYRNRIVKLWGYDGLLKVLKVVDAPLGADHAKLEQHIKDKLNSVKDNTELKAIMKEDM